MAPLPIPHPTRRSGASRLRASLGTFGSSIDAPQNFLGPVWPTPKI